MSSAYENSMSDQQANNYTQQYPVYKLCAHILCSNGALFCGYCSDHQSERAEAAEARVTELEKNLDLANAHAARLMQERDERNRRIESLQATLNTIDRDNDALRAESSEWHSAFIAADEMYRNTRSERDTAIAQAVAAEREACALIAEKRSSGLTSAELNTSKITARAIAAAIRARSNGAGRE